MRGVEHCRVCVHPIPVAPRPIPRAPVRAQLSLDADTAVVLTTLGAPHCSSSIHWLLLRLAYTASTCSAAWRMICHFWYVGMARSCGGGTCASDSMQPVYPTLIGKATLGCRGTAVRGTRWRPAQRAGAQVAGVQRAEERH